ncbi:MAG: hypothetical protein KBF73_09895 [Flavobacteriales bacterium]|nr:hypothetical protein [Flavobacteriales bacterium]
MRAFLYITIAITLFACGGSESVDVLGPIMGQEKAHFRGSSIGDKYENVLKQAAMDNPISTEEGVLNCEFKVENSELLVRYEFDQDKLYAIQADIFFADTASLNSFQQSLVNQYNSSFGEVNLDSGFLVWRNRESDTEVEFELADESIEFGQPKLSLTIYNFDN